MDIWCRTSADTYCLLLVSLHDRKLATEKFKMSATRNVEDDDKSVWLYMGSKTLLDN